jgi:hypothetical protein
MCYFSFIPILNNQDKTKRLGETRYEEIEKKKIYAASVEIRKMISISLLLIKGKRYVLPAAES